HGLPVRRKLPDKRTHSSGVRTARRTQRHPPRGRQRPRNRPTTRHRRRYQSPGQVPNYDRCLHENGNAQRTRTSQAYDRRRRKRPRGGKLVGVAGEDGGGGRVHREGRRALGGGDRDPGKRLGV
ncbi:hypothetical protein H0H92_015518, partial [Tricholoma furcatifolium]